jgi:hypothetical protein
MATNKYMNYTGGPVSNGSGQFGGQATMPGGMPPEYTGSGASQYSPEAIAAREAAMNGMPPPPGDPNTATPGGMPPPPGNDGYNGYNYDSYTQGGGGSGAWGDGFNPVETNSYGGQTIAGSNPSAADYDSVRQYSDAAYDDARRYLDPQQGFDNRRFQQEMINKGIDPNSPAGQKMYSDMMRAHGDQDSGAAFDSMQFGQGIQDQMFQQEFANQGLAGDMQKALWENQRGKYGMDQNYDLGNQAMGITRQNNDWNQMMELDSVDFRNRGYADSLQQYQDQLGLSLLGNNPVPAGSTIDPDGSQTRNGWGWGYNNSNGI